MAESDTILQLGIEAAREGNREEARNLFSLLTRQEPNNVQGWLWLAGVADGPEERRAALERVVELDPNNEMANKGLQAMGVAPAVASRSAEYYTPPSSAVNANAALSEEELYAAELDSAFDDYDSVPKEGPAFGNEPTMRHTDDDRSTEGRATARERIEGRRAALRYDDDDRPVRRGPSRLLITIVGLIFLVLIVFLVFTLINRGDTQAGADGDPAVAATQTAEALGALGNGTPLPDATPELTPVIPPLDATPEPELEPTPEPEIEPPAEPPTQPEPPDVAAAQPEPVPINTLLEANGWTYTYPSETYTAVFGPQLGNFTAQGSYVLTLVFVANNTGSDQPVPADFFALRDAQGNIYEPQPPLSSAYVIRGVNADRSMEDAIPANGLLTSIPLIFDVQRGATDLVLFTRGNTAQGWRVLNAVP